MSAEIRIITAFKQYPNLKVVDGYPFAVTPDGLTVLRLTDGELLGPKKLYGWNDGAQSAGLAVTHSKLVATAFLPNPNNYKRLVFIDGNPNNAAVSNLRWGGRNNGNTSVYRKAARIIVHTPMGTFKSLRAAASAVGINAITLKRYIETGLEGFTMELTSLKPKKTRNPASDPQKYYVDGQYFKNIIELAKYWGICRNRAIVRAKELRDETK